MLQTYTRSNNGTAVASSTPINFLLNKIKRGCSVHHLNEHLAKKAVSKMKNVDGTTGEHWTLEQIETLIKNHKLDYSCYDFYYLMNMLYSDFEGVLGDNADLYLKMACACIDDPDADEGKVFRIWKSRYVS